MKLRGKIGKVFLGLLFWIIAVWSFAIVSFAAPPTAKNLKWGGEYGLTAQWDLKNYYDNTVYVQLKRNGEAVTGFKRVPKLQNNYDFGEDFADTFWNGNYTFLVKVRESGANAKETVVESPVLKFEMEKYLQFKDQYPAFNPGQDEQIIRVKVGDTLTFKFNNVPLPEPFAEKYNVFKTCGLTYWTGGKDVPKTEDANNNYHDHIPVEFKYTFTETGTAYILEQLSYTDKNFGSPSYEKKGYTYSISRKFCIVVEPKPCSHNYQELSNTATCTTSGEKNMYCRLCGDAVTEYVAKLGHDVIQSYQYGSDTHWTACDRCWIIMNEKPHTYNSSGTCTVCGYSYNNSCEPMDDGAHEHDEKYHWYWCKEHYSESDGSIIFKNCPNNGVMEKGLHQIKTDSAGEAVYSCQNGYTCEICVEYYGSTGQHKWVLDKASSTPATYTSEGRSVYRCAYNGMRDGRNATINCSAKKTVVLKKLVHNWDYTKVLKDTATCTKDGKRTIGCKDSGCKGKMSIVSVAKGHKYGIDNVCDTCGYKKAVVSAAKDPIVMTDTKTKTKYQLDLRDKKSSSVLFFAPKNKKITKITIPTTVKIDGLTYKVSGIADNAFQGCTKLKTVTIGKNVTYIGKKAFYGCSLLKTVSMGKNVETIGDNAFAKCKALLKITLPAKTKIIGKSAFYGCSKLKTVILGKNIKTISEKAFYKCIVLTKITIPSKVEYIGKEAFYGCKKLKSIKISTSKLTADNVGAKAFSGTYSKATVKVPSKKVKVYKKLLVQKGMHKKAKIGK